MIAQNSFSTEYEITKQLGVQTQKVSESPAVYVPWNSVRRPFALPFLRRA